jgi:hypothetical protein
LPISYPILPPFRNPKLNPEPSPAQADATTAAARTVATAVANLCDNHPANLAAVRECGGVVALVALLWTGPHGDAVEQVRERSCREELVVFQSRPVSPCSGIQANCRTHRPIK